MGAVSAENTGSVSLLWCSWLGGARISLCLGAGGKHAKDSQSWLPCSLQSLLLPSLIFHYGSQSVCPVEVTWEGA